MHANLLLTNLMRLLRPIKWPANTAQPDSPTQYAADQAGFGVPQVSALKEAVVRAISQIEHGEHPAAREAFADARRSWNRGDIVSQSGNSRFCLWKAKTMAACVLRTSGRSPATPAPTVV